MKESQLQNNIEMAKSLSSIQLQVFRYPVVGPNEDYLLIARSNKRNPNDCMSNMKVVKIGKLEKKKAHLNDEESLKIYLHKLMFHHPAFCSCPDKSYVVKTKKFNGNPMEFCLQCYRERVEN